MLCVQSRRARVYRELLCALRVFVCVPTPTQLHDQEATTAQGNKATTINNRTGTIHKTFLSFGISDGGGGSGGDDVIPLRLFFSSSSYKYYYHHHYSTPEAAVSSAQVLKR